MKRFLSLALVVALVGLGVPAPLAAAPAPLSNGQISGIAMRADHGPMANATTRLRNLASGQHVAVTMTNALGQFSFARLREGQYMAELVDAAGNIIGTSRMLTLSPGVMTVSGVMVNATAAGAAGQGAAGGGLGAFFTSTAGIVLLAAVGVGVTVAIVKATGSPSK